MLILGLKGLKYSISVLQLQVSVNWLRIIKIELEKLEKTSPCFFKFTFQHEKSLKKTDYG